MGFSKHEYWSGLPFPSPENLPDPGIEPRSLALWADYLPAEPQGNLRAQTVKHLPAMRETLVRSLGQEDSLEKEMATHSSTLALKI